MAAKWIFLFVLSLTTMHAHAQLNGETYSRSQWKGLPFIKRTNNLNALKPNTCGVYTSSGDRQSGTLSMAIDCSSEFHKIKAGFIRDKSAIRIVRQDTTYRYLRGDLYGYRDCRGNEYHFFEGKNYLLINPGEGIPIYRIFQRTEKQLVTKYFFSKGSTGPIRPLTLKDLRAEFAEETSFLANLRLLARNDFELVKYLYAINQVRMQNPTVKAVDF